MAGVAASRFGLWMFDLSVIQQMQVRMLKHSASCSYVEEICHLHRSS